MKIIVTFCTLILLGVNSFAQKINVEWGTKYKEAKGEDLEGIIYDDGTYLYAVSNQHSKTNLQGKSTVVPSLIKLDYSLEQVARVEIETTEKEMEYHGIYFFGGNFLMLTKKLDKKANTQELFLQRFDKDLKKLDNMQSFWKVSVKKGKSLDYAFSFSEDSSKFMMSVVPETNKKEKVSLAFKVIDAQLNTLFETAEELQYGGDVMELEQVVVNNANDVFISAKLYEKSTDSPSKKSNMGDVPAYKLMILKYSKGKKMETFNIDMGNKFLDVYDLSINRSGDLRLIGTFIDSWKDYEINGIFYVAVNSKTGEITAQNSDKWPKNIFKPEVLAKTKSGKSPGLSTNFKITKFKVMDDGKMYLILEENYYNVTTMKSGATYVTYYSEDILAMQINSTGKIDWANIISKKQFYNSITTYLYHVPMFYNNKVYIFFLDHKENETYVEKSDKGPKRFNALKDMSLIMVEMDANGKMVRKVAGRTETMGTNVLISRSKQISGNNMFLYGYDFKAKTNKLGLVKFE